MLAPAVQNPRLSRGSSFIASLMKSSMKASTAGLLNSGKIRANTGRRRHHAHHELVVVSHSGRTPAPSAAAETDGTRRTGSTANEVGSSARPVNDVGDPGRLHRVLQGFAPFFAVVQALVRRVSHGCASPPGSRLIGNDGQGRA